MRELNPLEINAVSGGNAAEDGEKIGGAIGSVIDDIAGFFGVKLHTRDILSAIGRGIGGIIDHIHSRGKSAESIAP